MLLRHSLLGRLRTALFLCGGLLASTAALAHGVRSDVRVVLTPVPVKGLTVQLHQDLIAPQLAVSNRTGKLLEVLDDDGRVFLRLGPKEASGDVKALAFHLSRGTAGADLRPSMLSKTPQWQRLGKEPAYGWFDPRIATEKLEIPYGIQSVGRSTPFGEWRIAARLGGEPLSIGGIFLYEPPPAGQVQSRLLSSAAPAPGVSVSLTPRPVPMIFVSNSGKLPLNLLDENGRPWLRIGPDGVWADAGSAFWRGMGGTGGKGWQKLSAASSHAWADPRTAWRGAAPASSSPQTLKAWQLPMRLGDQALLVKGAAVWLPNPPAALAKKP